MVTSSVPGIGPSAAGGVARRVPAGRAIREYVRHLPLVIGNAEAGRYEARWVAYQEATEHVEQLSARLGMLPSMDATDRQLQQQLTDEQTAAGTAFEAAAVALEAALERARALDYEPDKTGGT